MFKQCKLSISILLILTCFFSSCSSSGKDKFDLLIKGGKIIDGTGNPRFFGDIGIKGDIIAEIGNLDGRSAARAICADGLIVSPGFIDVHTHCDEDLGKPASNENLNYLTQGVTTVVTGNCGNSISLNARETKREWEAQGIGTNAVFLVGHGNIRKEIVGNEPREATSQEIDQMQDILRKSLKNGAWGMSIRLEHHFGMYANTEEMTELAKVIKEYGGIYATHLRNYSNNICEAIRENATIGEKTGVHVVISHFMVTGKKNWGLAKDALKVIEEAGTRGVYIFADMFPYTNSNTSLIQFFLRIPPDMKPFSELRKELRDPNLSAYKRRALQNRYMDELRKALIEPEKREMIRRLTVDGSPGRQSPLAMREWHDFTILVANKNSDLVGTNFCDLPGAQCRDLFDIIVELALDEPNILYGDDSQSEENLKYALSRECVIVSSDGGAARIVDSTVESIAEHPREFGSQTKILRKYVREEGLLTLEEVIKKMTSVPASVLQLRDRGTIKKGFKADIVIFDPETVRDNSTYSEVACFCSGIEHLIVNGEISIDGGTYNGGLHGKMLMLMENQ